MPDPDLGFFFCFNRSLQTFFFFNFTQSLKVTFNSQLLQKTAYIPRVVHYILEPILYPVVCSSHSPPRGKEPDLGAKLPCHTRLTRVEMRKLPAEP